MSLQKRLSAGEFIVMAEMDTPKGVDISELITNARRIKGRIDAVVVPDMANGVMRMSSLGGAVLMQQQGLETVIHLCPRDRNRLALQGDILSAHVLGLQNLVIVPGESVDLGDHPGTKEVDDLDELALLKAARSLMNGFDLSGLELKGRPSLTVGASLRPYGDDEALAAELDSAAQKIEAGAGFLFHPPVFDVGQFADFMEKSSALPVPVFPAVFLIKSVGVARYMNSHLPGVSISEESIKRIRTASDRVQECARIAGETLAALKEIAPGAVIQTLGWEYLIPAILDYAGF